MILTATHYLAIPSRHDQSLGVRRRGVVQAVTGVTIE